MVKSNKRKLRSVREIKQILDRYNNKCGMCKKELIQVEFHIDHIKALSLGGTDLINNLQPLCIPCHKIKTKQEGFQVFMRECSNYITCKICGRFIRGYKDNLNILMEQHLFGCNKSKEEKRLKGYLANEKGRKNKTMIKVTCDCGKEIEGYNENHANSLLSLHRLKHKEIEVLN